MIAPYNFLHLYCPSCGTPTRLDHAGNILRGKFKAKQALSCGVCGLRYQLVDNTEIFRAETASGGDLVEYFVDEE
jgi:transcription elongation factor Elf1